jgi:hypothetical protein
MDQIFSRLGDTMSRQNIHGIFFMLVVAINFMFIAPLLDSVMVGDDVWYFAQIKGTGLLQNKNVVQLTWDDTIAWIKTGRWFPLASYRVPVFYYLDRFEYKAVMAFTIMINIVLLGYFTRIISNSRWLALISMLLPPMFLQIRANYHDPILSYHFVMQLLVSLTLVSLVLFLRYLKNRTYVPLCASLFLYFISLLIYEVAYTFWVLYVLTAVVFLEPGKIKSALSSSLPFALLAGINIAITLILRSWFGTPYEGIQLNSGFSPWLIAFLKQTYAGLPLSCSISTDKMARIVLYLKDCGLTDTLALCSFWAISWYFVSFEYMKELTTGTHEGPNKKWILIGLALWILPSPLIALSVKYQAELKWGYGYLPVYISYFGIMIIVSILISRLYLSVKSRKRLLRSTVIAIVTAAGCFTVAINYGGNRYGISSKSHDLHQRQLAINALKDNLMKFVPANSYVLAPSPVDSRFVRMYAGISVNLASPLLEGFELGTGAKSVETIFRPFLSSESGCYIFDQPAQPFIFRYESLPGGAGYAVLAALNRMSVFNTSIQGAASSRIYLYWHTPSRCANPPQSVYVVGSWLDKDSLEQKGLFKFDISKLNLINTGSNGNVYQLPSTLLPGYVDIRSLTMFGASEDVRNSTFWNPASQYPDLEHRKDFQNWPMDAR